MLGKILVAVALVSAVSVPVSAQADTAADVEALKRIVAEQQKRIEALEKQLSAGAAPVAPAVAAAALPNPTPSMEPATRVGGYGELIYRNFDNEKTTDLARFVVYFGHRFDDSTRFDSEFEVAGQFIENADGVAEGGEVEVEQAYIEHAWNRTYKSRFGLFIVPIGIINERHEPPTFYGVERNPIETFIIPTTLSDRGVQTIGTFDSGLSFDLAVSGGLRAENEDPGEEFIPDHISPEGVANAESPAVTGRIAWRGLPGLELAATALYQADGAQKQLPNVGHASFMEAHAIYKVGGADFRGLYARYEIGGSAPRVLDRDVQQGGYLEASYRVLQPLGFFARYNVWDNGGLGGDTEIRQTNIGLNYWLIPEFAIKGDVQWQSGATDRDGFNLGFGYQF